MCAWREVRNLASQKFRLTPDLNFLILSLSYFTGAVGTTVGCSDVTVNSVFRSYQRNTTLNQLLRYYNKVTLSSVDSPVVPNRGAASP